MMRGVSKQLVGRSTQDVIHGDPAIEEHQNNMVIAMIVFMAITKDYNAYSTAIYCNTTNGA